MLAGEERSLDEWGKIRLFEVGPQVPPWRDRLFKCREQKNDFVGALEMAVKAARCNEGSACPEHENETENISPDFNLLYQAAGLSSNCIAYCLVLCMGLS